jgi:AcrR family transcriptional regulator
MGHELTAAVRERRRDRIIAVATEVFLEHGYAATTMTVISQRLGGSKATLYAYFRNKDELCEAIVQRQGDQLLGVIHESGSQPSLKRRLMQVGLAMMQILTSEEGVRLMQLAIEGSRTNPELAQRFETVALRVITEKLADMIEDGDRRGEVCAPDPLEAANVFTGLMRGDLHFRRLFNLLPEPTADQRRTEVLRAIRVFMTAFAPAAPGSGRSSCAGSDR